MCLTKLLEFLDEDRFDSDITTRYAILEDRKTSARIVSNSKGILAGIRYARMLFEHFDFHVKILKEDGSRIQENNTILQVTGSLKSLLATERTVLNLLTRMSGVATETHRLVSLVPSHIEIAGTRKTVPGFRYFDKKAIEIGGGYPHRLDLSDAILIKDNHLKFITDIKKTVSEIKKEYGDVDIEIEAESVDEAIRFAETDVDSLMLDNFTVSDIRKTTEILSKMGVRKTLKIELSGNITPHNIENYVDLDVDRISSGWITHSAMSLDFSLEII